MADPQDRSPEDIERQWREIVQGLGPDWPPAGTAPEPGEAPLPPAAGPRPPQDALPGDTVPGSGPVDDTPAWGPRDYPVDDDDGGDFIPPEPPALGSGNPAVVLSIVGVAGAPAVLLLSAILWPSIPGVVVLVLIAAFVAGAVGLFLALPRDSDRQDPWGDDGAQV